MGKRPIFLEMMPKEWKQEITEDFLSDVSEMILRSGEKILLRRKNAKTELPVVTAKEQLESFFYRLCEWSVHACRDTLIKGYITLADGCRVGVAGEAVVQNGRICTVKNVRSLHLRFARTIKGASDELYEAVFAKSPCGLLLVGPPGSGKTTILRDLCAKLAKKGYSVSVVDERRELADKSLASCDLLLGYPKAAGTEIALRCLSPDFICVDELAGKEECEEMRLSACGGAYPLVAVHGHSLGEIANRPTLKPLFECGAFGAVALLSQTVQGRIEEIVFPDEGGFSC